MPRTPLAAALRRLAADHLLAEERDVPVEAIREERALRPAPAARGLTRRRFLGGAAASILGGGLALPRAAAARPGPRIAIVGGGIAGLTCALTLRDFGIDATVYEAGGRIGGRMFSNDRTWAEDQVTEWYGELIDTGHGVVQSLAERFSLPLISLLDAQPRGSEDVYHFFGQYYDKADADRDFRQIRRALRADERGAGYPTTWDSSTAAGRALDSISVYDWIESRVPGGHDSPLGALLDVAYAAEYAADTRDQSALNLLYLLAYQPQPGKLSIFGESDEAFRIAGGNGQLPRAIARHLGPAVRTGVRMESLRRTGGGRYDLTFRDGPRALSVRADLVVLALPFAVLRTLDIDGAGFDARKRRAIRELGRGRAAKRQLQFTARPWNGRGPWPGKSNGGSYSDQPYELTWESTRGQPGTGGILTNFLGPAGVARLRAPGPLGATPSPLVTLDAARFLSQVQPVYPGLQPLWNGRATVSLPHLDPQLGLAYSYWRVGQYQDFAGYEAAIQGGVHFAGEHTSLSYQGYMEGGAETGVRAAQEILARL